MDNSTYEDIPYDSRPQYPTHPNCLSTLGVLFGLSPAPRRGRGPDLWRQGQFAQFHGVGYTASLPVPQAPA